jgi:hypothetical protein
MQKYKKVMKTIGKISLTIVFLGAFLYGCTEKAGMNLNTSLKQAVYQSATDLNTAVSNLSSTKAFSILTMSSGSLKSATATDATYKVYITLDTVKGLYQYKPATRPDKWGWSLIKFFKKTSDNSKMIVQMPLSKISNPRTLRQYNPADSTLKNNFQITVSDYHNNYNSYWDYDYNLASEISIDNATAGNLNIKSIVSPANGIQYASSYVFSGSYTAKYAYTSGDTTLSSFSILNGSTLLYQEKLQTVRNDTARFGREKTYTLTIGNVQLVRKAGSTSVYVDGILQPAATVTVIDKAADSEASVVHKRDIQITFEDGTTTTISALIGKSIDNMATLFDSLHSVYFAAYVVDWIAYDIYYGRN